MSIEKSIGWTDMTLNPIRGHCLGNCKLPDGRAYCYYSGKRGIMNRFRHNPKIRIECNVFLTLPKTPKKVFLCSTHDLFGDWIVRGWRDTIFRWIERYPQHIFQILTKFPQNIDCSMPDNVWLGTTVTKADEWSRLVYLSSAKIRFVSFEPMIENPNISFSRNCGIDWIIIGRLTGYGHRYDPEREWIEDIVGQTKECGIPVFMKNNLKDIWGKQLIQEFPREEDSGERD